MTPGVAQDGPRVVALGGGHGLAASLQALRRVTPHLTAVVTVADDGGSSGRLRRQMDVLPPGDLRMALAALAGSDEWSSTWARLLQHRFPGQGDLAGHAVGNLVLTGLTQTTGGCIPALDLVGRLVGAVGRVLPASVEPLDIVAQVVGLDPREPNVVREVAGQHAVATTPGTILTLRLRPDAPVACEEAVQAVRAADWVVLGPGSWFTSVLTHLLVPGLRQGLEQTSARRLVALNLTAQAGETAGYSPEAHLHVLTAHAPGLGIDAVLADPGSLSDAQALADATARAGARLVLTPVRADDGSPRHDPVRLAEAYRSIFTPDPLQAQEPAWR